MVLGDVSSGKSSLSGHLLYQVGAIDRQALTRVERQLADMNIRVCKYSWLLDTVQSERWRGFTMNIKIRHFETRKYRLTWIDTPGHRDFFKNMITGISQVPVSWVLCSFGDMI